MADANSNYARSEFMTPSNQLAEARLAIVAAAIAGDSGRLYGMVADMMSEGITFESILFDLLMPTEQDVGRRWQDGDYLVSEEHAATATLETVVSLLAGSFDQPTEGAHVVVAAAEGDQHSFPGRIVNAHLLFLGYRTTFLGANVLASDLRDFLLDGIPDAVVLSCAMTNHLPGARAAITECHAAGVPVLAGGRGFGQDGIYARRLGADGWVATPRDVATMIESWEPDPSASEAGAVDPGEELETITIQRSAITAAALTELERQTGNPADARLRDELSLLLGSVEASLLVEDGHVIVEAMRWQAETLAAHGRTESTVLSDSLARVLGGYSTEAAAILAQGV